ncbi:MAG: hypothetical protein FJW24_02425 [Acidimicrobiia bacterium]|nr:hypothetical protein [Acidimicrobiia bacterium]
MADDTPKLSDAPSINPVIAEMHAQNDRGAAVCGGAFLEEKLQEAIEEQWPPISNTVRDRLFTGFGPLASFSAKIAIAHAIGMVDTITKSDCDKIRLIRNAAAHIGTPFSFESSEIRKILSEIALLRYMPPDQDKTSTHERNQFTGAVKCLSAYLWLQAKAKKKFGHHTVMPGFDKELPPKSA